MQTAKTLEQLGTEYEQAAQVLTARISAARRRLAQAGDSRCGREAYRIKAELATLYGERREALETASRLLNYYCKNERRRLGERSNNLRIA